MAEWPGGDARSDGDGPRPREVGDRVTEIGPYETVDTTEHTAAPWVAFGLLIAVIVFVAIGLGRAVEDSDRRVDVPDIEVPSVSGMTEDAARERLEIEGLIMVVKESPNEVVPAGAVFEQKPIAGAKVELGSPVTALVSTGPAGTVVPETVGQQVAEATAQLSTVGLTARPVPTADEKVRPGEVMASTPAAGERAPADRVVELAVSSGPAPRIVPDPANLSGVQYLAELGRIGLLPGDVTHEASSGRPEGSVVSVSPAPGSSLPRYSEVDVVIAGTPAASGHMPGVVGLEKSTAADALSAADVQASFRTVALPAGDANSGRVVFQGVAGGSPLPPGTVVEIVVGEAPPPTTTVPPAGPTSTTVP